MTSTLSTVVNGNNHPMQVFKHNLLIHKISNNDQNIFTYTNKE